MTIEEAIVKYPVNITDIIQDWKETPCEIWTESISNAGYGFIWDNSKRSYILAHRFIFESRRGKIPIFKQLDHLCRNRACVNFLHLEIVSSRENIRRGKNQVAKKMAQTTCIKEHELSTKSNGKRYCKICVNTKKRNARGNA